MAKLSKQQKQELIEQAWQAAAHSYSPYSHFAVGAAALGINGKVYRGCNVENASYGLTNCAERTAIFSMVADGCRTIAAIAVVVNSVEVTPPCGACRQVMAEFCDGPDMPVLLANGSTELEETLRGIFPYAALDLKTND